ncbi:MAG: thiamine pyrophosphate-binding protein [Alphaproteobacteria bacterium]
MTTGNDYLANTMAECGLTHFFNMPFILPNAIKSMQRVGVQPIITHSEKAAAYMADGYARASGKLGVCAAQQIGAANLAAGLLDAYMGRSPVLAITGGSNANMRDRNNYQEVDQQPVFAGLVKMHARVDAVGRLPDLLGQAMRVATTGAPGPVHLEFGEPAGALMDQEFAFAPPVDARYANAPAIRHAAPAEDVKAAIAALAKAKRPIIVAGSGIRSSGATEALRRFYKKANVPIATSLDAKSAPPEDDPLSVGVVGRYSREIANQAVAEADFVLFVGSTTGTMVTADFACPKPGVDAVQIDVDPRELGRNYPLLVGLAGDSATILDQLTAALGAPSDLGQWLQWISDIRADWRASVNGFEISDAEPIRPERLTKAVSDALPDNALITVDTGHTAIWATRHLYLNGAKQSLLRCAGSLGWAYPAALGAKCAQPERPVICFSGDGAFLYHLTEMETAKRYGINAITVINNNNAYSQEKPRWVENNIYDHNWIFSPVSYAKVAEGFGHKAYVVEHARDIGAAMKDALKANAPAIIEVITDPLISSPPPWRPGAPLIRARG